jgi:hypothetical protein
MDWSGTGVRADAAVIQFSPHSPREQRDRLDAGQA